MQSLYFHFPFCESKCHYCDFYSLGKEKTRPSDPDRFEKALIQEIQMRIAFGDRGGEIEKEIYSIFLGGGTPSMTPPAVMERIFKTLFSATKLADQAEWTMEANPSSIEFEQFKSYRALGINRVSMGVQSLRNDHLEKLGRVHDEASALRALDTVFSAGFSNVSTDLLCGVPGQTVDDLEQHLTALSQFPITHLSIYLLTLSKHHRMFSELPNEDEQLRHLLFIDEFMRNQGFEHYEISNFAKPGFRARHNLVYWQGGSYLGFGPSAHSYNQTTQTRFKNISSLHAYAQHLQEQKLPVEWTEHLTPEQIQIEKWMLAIRLEEGFPQEWITKPSLQSKVNILTREGLLAAHPHHKNRIHATARGFAFSDSLVKELITE